MYKNFDKSARTYEKHNSKELQKIVLSKINTKNISILNVSISAVRLLFVIYPLLSVKNFKMNWNFQVYLKKSKFEHIKINFKNKNK